MSNDENPSTRHAVTTTVLAALSVAVALLGNVAAAFWTGIITGIVGTAIGSLLAGIGSELLNAIPGF